MMKKILVFLLVILVYCVSLQANLSEQQETERFLLSGHGDIRISVNTGWQYDGLIPVRIDINGVYLELCMDKDGRVFEGDWLELSPGGSRELFHLDPENGRLKTKSVVIEGDVYESNDLRKRLRLRGLEVAISLDIDRKRAIIELGGIVIPVHMRLGKEVNGLRELQIGDIATRQDGKLFLDVGRGELLLEENHAQLDTRGDKTGMIRWAEKQR